MASNTESERAKLEKKAKKLGLTFEETTSDAELTDLIQTAEAAASQAGQEGKIEKNNIKKVEDGVKNTNFILKDSAGNDVDPRDYFFWNPTDEYKKTLKPGEKVHEIPPFFHKWCGYPVDREDLLEAFHRVFKKEDGFLFYKARDKELYLIIVPLKKAKTVSEFNESIHGDFQRHAISFINEGSVNIDSLLQKLQKVATHPTIGEK